MAWLRRFLEVSWSAGHTGPEVILASHLSLRKTIRERFWFPVSQRLSAGARSLRQLIGAGQ